MDEQTVACLRELAADVKDIKSKQNTLVEDVKAELFKVVEQKLDQALEPISSKVDKMGTVTSLLQRVDLLEKHPPSAATSTWSGGTSAGSNKRAAVGDSPTPMRLGGKTSGNSDGANPCKVRSNGISDNQLKGKVKKFLEGKVEQLMPGGRCEFGVFSLSPSAYTCFSEPRLAKEFIMNTGRSIMYDDASGVEHERRVRMDRTFDDRMWGKVMGCIWTKVTSFLKLDAGSGSKRLGTRGPRGQIFIYSKGGGDATILFRVTKDQGSCMYEVSAMCSACAGVGISTAKADEIVGKAVSLATEISAKSS